MGPSKPNYNMLLIKLTVVTLSGFHCTLLFIFFRRKTIVLGRHPGLRRHLRAQRRHDGRVVPTSESPVAHPGGKTVHLFELSS